MVRYGRFGIWEERGRGRGTYHEGQLNEQPDGVDEHQVPVMREIGPGDRVRLRAHGKDGLHGDVHNHKALGSEAEWKHLERVGDEQAGPRERVEDTIHPNDGDLGPAGGLVLLVAVLVDGARDGPAGEHGHHADHGDEEELAAADFVDHQRGADGDDECQDGVAAVELGRALVEWL